ncbi:MAG: copper amine oxidase N-terminal domain-containing protein [Desulfotomaculaceae bacterium]|nr:copper amine oxidase N-terminal domain-containing protein [Desulfotomaculaceae bacterium]MDD4767029.1 copper amine oxidase N-terminal domain-containing protein [Desulfotomaculaceae bacterium]
MKTRGVIMTAVSFILFLGVIILSAGPAMAAATYEPLTDLSVRSGRVSELGVIKGEFTAGTLREGDSVVLTLPAGYIWTTADPGSGESVAAAAYQTTEEWNTMEVTSGNVIYGTGNYIKIPSGCSGEDNGLYRGATPLLQFTRLNDREVLMELLAEPVSSRACCLFIHAERVYVAGGSGDYVSLDIDAPAGSGFDSGAGVYNSVEGIDIPSIYAGIPEQQIGTVVIHEAAAGRFGAGQVLSLRLPSGAAWVKLAEDSDHGLAVSGSISDDGRTADFRFSGKSSAAADLELTGMAVELEKDLYGLLNVRVSGSAGLAGELTVARGVPPAAVFTVGQAEFAAEGVKYTIDIAPYIKDDRVFLPVRYFAHAAGVTDDNITWRPGDRSVEIGINGRVVKMTIDSSIMYVDNKAVQMDVAPEIISPGRTMLPLRWIAEALGYDVYWDAVAQRVFVLGVSDS